jgi:hypothetical protein
MSDILSKTCLNLINLTIFVTQKGQTNSKWFFQANVSSNKQMNKFKFTTGRLDFARSLEESEDTKSTFRN